MSPNWLVDRRLAAVASGSAATSTAVSVTNAPPGPMRSVGSGEVMTGSPRSIQPDPGIEECVENIDDQTERHEYDHPEGGYRHDDRIVVVQDRFVEQQADTLVLEDRLGDDRAAEQRTDPNSDIGDDRDDRVSHGVLSDHLSFGKALGS